MAGKTPSALRPGRTWRGPPDPMEEGSTAPLLQGARECRSNVVWHWGTSSTSLSLPKKDEAKEDCIFGCLSTESPREVWEVITSTNQSPGE